LGPPLDNNKDGEQPREFDIIVESGGHVEHPDEPYEYWLLEHALAE
jgi:hypothetical protein